MSGDPPRLRALDTARASGLVRAGTPVLVLLSGGADSVCLLGVARELDARVSALHVNYGLRGESSDGDEAWCREVCERLGVVLRVERVALPGAGNLQAAARDARYALAEEIAERDYAVAHTASDQAET
ncbi:MAG: 7-cyano-7-deazaguanine synthase, partial [Thermoleophilaceae bacterium]|nr:7-cyano-7-deazaguanine synthase [Thermoleophilaceae bacterium]